MILSVAAWSMVGCSEEDDYDIKTLPSDLPNIVKSDAPSWKRVDGVIPFGSMVIYMTGKSLPKTTTLSQDDMIAAFEGNECRGIWTPAAIMGGDADIVLQVFGKDADIPGATRIELRYYCASQQGYYVSAPISYSSYQTLGSIGNPYMPVWK